LCSTTCTVGLVRSDGKSFWAHAVREFVDLKQFVEWLNIGPTAKDSIEDVRVHEIKLDGVCNKFVPFARKAARLFDGSPNHHMYQLMPQE